MKFKFNAFRPKVAFVMVACSLIGAPGFLSATEAATLADGAPWTMTNSNGPNGELVLNSDGSGQMRARGMRMKMSWQSEGDQLCLNSRMRGTRCVVLVPQEGGFAGVEDGEVAFTLTR